jgi:hypothetical protein
MVALVATIHVFFSLGRAGGAKQVVDGRPEADHDGLALSESRCDAGGARCYRFSSHHTGAWPAALGSPYGGCLG